MYIYIYANAFLLFQGIYLPWMLKLLPTSPFLPPYNVVSECIFSKRLQLDNPLLILFFSECVAQNNVKKAVYRIQYKTTF